MALRAADIPRVVVERIGAKHPHPAHFEYAEVCDWPDGALRELTRVGLLIEAGPAQSVVCPGCEWQCHKTPTVRRDAAGRRRAYISCDEEPAHGRIRLPICNLVQYEATARRLSESLIGLLGLATVRATASGNTYDLGNMKGRYGTRTIGLIVADVHIDVTVGDQREPVLSVLSMTSSGLVADRAFLRRMADRKTRTGRVERVPDRSRQQARKRNTQTRNAKVYSEAKRLKTSQNTWSDVAKTIAGTPLAEGLSAGRVRKIITEKRAAERK